MNIVDKMDHGLEEINTTDQIINYNRAVGTSQLADLRMICSNFKVSDDYWNDDVKRSFNINRTSVGCSFEDDNIATAVFKFEAIARSSKKILMKIMAEYAVTYSFADGIDPESAKMFSKRVGMFAAYPYFRSWVSTVSSSANVHLPVLPVIASRASPIKATELKEG